MQLSHMLKSLIITLPFLVFTVAATESKNYFPKESNNKLEQNDVRHLVKMNPTNYITENGSYKKIQEDLNKVYFDFDKSTIKRDYAKILDEHAKFLLSHPSYNVMIEGHADERGTFIYNFALGERRALAVKDYLLSRGVSSRQLYTVSYGKEKPAVFGHDAKTYAQNRRTVIVY